MCIVDIQSPMDSNKSIHWSVYVRFDIGKNQYQCHPYAVLLLPLNISNILLLYSHNWYSQLGNTAKIFSINHSKTIIHIAFLSSSQNLYSKVYGPLQQKCLIPHTSRDAEEDAGQAPPETTSSRIQKVCRQPLEHTYRWWKKNLHHPTCMKPL